MREHVHAVDGSKTCVGTHRTLSGSCLSATKTTSRNRINVLSHSMKVRFDVLNVFFVYSSVESVFLWNHIETCIQSPVNRGASEIAADGKGFCFTRCALEAD